MTKIDRNKYMILSLECVHDTHKELISRANRRIDELCDAYDALAADPRLSLVATAERPEDVDVVRIFKYAGEQARAYRSFDDHTPDGTCFSESRWLTIAALHAAFPFTPPPDPRIAELAALKAKVAALEAEIGGAS